MSLGFVVGLALSGGIGLSLGLIGAGGSIVTVPVLVYAFGVAPARAVGMSLAVVGLTSLAGVGSHARQGAVRGKAALLFALPGVPAAYFASRLTYLVPPRVLLVLFAGLMVVVGLRLLFAGAAAEKAGRASPLRLLLAGFAVGGLTGFLGVGGGFLIVPALVLFAGLRMREAVGTSLAVIAVNCAAGLAGHWGHGFDLGLTLVVSALAVGGVVVGAALSRHVPAPRLRRIFAIAVLAVAAFLLVKNLGPASSPARETRSPSGGTGCPEVGSPVPCLRRPSAPRPSGSAASSTSSSRRSTSRSGTTTPTPCWSPSSSRPRRPTSWSTR